MNEIISPEELFSKAQTLYDNGNTFSEIEDCFKKNGIDENHIHEVIKHVVSYKNKKRFLLGFKLILLGAAFLLSSCMLSLLTSYSNSNFIFVLYGLTSIGACILTAGFILIFG